MEKSKEKLILPESEIEDVFKKLGLPLETRQVIFTPVEQYTDYTQPPGPFYVMRLSNSSELSLNTGR